MNKNGIERLLGASPDLEADYHPGHMGREVAFVMADGLPGIDTA